MDGKLLNHETIRTTNVFVAAYIFIFAASFFLVSLNGFVMVSSFTAVAAALDGIGPVLSQRIVEYREANGPFASVEGLLEVKGLGPGILEAIRPQLTAEEEP